MKKILSIILSFTLVFSSMVFFANAPTAAELLTEH